ncbi:STAS/SEC14 domain-containing protein [candidate division WOR-3 bacterium]|nr:STAS/SEC14 domain-containing protein [candidate division WOR-3 bacterium]
MKYKVEYNEKKEVIDLKVYDSLTKEEAYELVDLLEELLQGKAYYGMLVDLSEDKAKKGMSKEVRQVFKESTDKVDLKKVCVIGARSVTRMTAKIMLGLMGNTSTTFCKNRTEALNWLKGDKKNEPQSTLQRKG